MSTAPSNILALVPNWIGDVAMCTPALRALHRRFPDAAITACGTDAACELLRGLPGLADLVPCDTHAGPVELWRTARRLRGRDVAVIFPHSFRAALLARLTGARRRYGYDRDGRACLLTNPVPPYREHGEIAPIYMAAEYLDLVKPLGCEDDGKGLELRADPAAVAAVQARLTPNRLHVGIAPGAAFGPSKLWPAERFAQVADVLAERSNAECLLLTGPGEETIRDAVVAAGKTPLIQRDDARPSIEMLKAAVSQLDLLICNDSGARHVAVAFHVPVVCLMGPTSPRYTEGPYERGRVLRVDIDCGPCQKPVCETDHRCMTRITVDQTVKAALQVLEERETYPT